MATSTRTHATPSDNHAQKEVAVISRTMAFTPTSGSAIDPLVEEITWRAWELVAADPQRLDERVRHGITLGFDCLVEATWCPGRSVVISEVALNPSCEEAVLTVRLAVGVMGPRGTTEAESWGLVPRAEAAASGAGCFSSRAIDPVVVATGSSSGRVDMNAAHAAHIVQGTWAFGDDTDLVEVVSRFAPTIEPWGNVVAQLHRLQHPVRVRACVLATELSPSDRLEFENGLRRAQEISDRNPDRPDIRFDADRARSTLLDLRASFSSPAVAGEVAVLSHSRLPDTFIRSLASSFTSESDVYRKQGQVVVASNRLLLGGFDIVRDPEGWQEAESLGVPLRGGLRPRRLQDLLTLTESPIGWPIPTGAALPGISTRIAADRPVPPILASNSDTPSTDIGRTICGNPVALPLELRTRHVLATGTWGAGKSTFLFAQALDDIRRGRPFLFIDPHGTAADELIAYARQHGVDPIVIDAVDAETERLRPLPSRGRTAASRSKADSAIRRVADAVASSLPNPEWAGPRWFQNFEALLELVVVHKGELIDAALWAADPSELRERMSHASLSPLAKGTLRMMLGGHESEELRGWVTSKLHPLVGGDVRRIIAPVGEGVDVGRAIASGRPVIISLAGVSTSEANLVGHLSLAATFDAAMQRPPGKRTLVTCYVDEGHRFPVRGLGRVMAEGRKFGISLMLATQSLGQLPAEFADLALGAGTQVVFRATPDTAARLSSVLSIPTRELLDQPDLAAVVAVQGHPPTSVMVPPIVSCTEPRVMRSPHEKSSRKRSSTPKSNGDEFKATPEPDHERPDLVSSSSPF